MNFIAKIAKNYPAVARFVEVTLLGLAIWAIISVVNWLIVFLKTWAMVDYKQILITFLVGILTWVTTGLTKMQRDLTNKKQ